MSFNLCESHTWEWLNTTMIFIAWYENILVMLAVSHILHWLVFLLLYLFDHYQLLFSTMEHCPSRNFQYKISQFLMSDHSSSLLHKQNFLYMRSIFLHFLNKEKPIYQNVTFFLPFLMLESVNKNKPVLIFFLSACWYNCCHNAIKSVLCE